MFSFFHFEKALVKPLSHFNIGTMAILTKRLFLLDGMALVYRAHFALIRSPIFNSKGVNTSAAYGFTNTLLTIIEKEAPTHLALVFDTSAPTLRHELYPEYKAQRDAMPEELAAAIPVVKEICEAFRIPVITKDGFEADDIIGTLASQADLAGDFETFMVTPDKDFAQLVTETTKIWKPGRQGSDREILDLPAILEKWEIERSSQVIDILALWGDVSDNIPGIPGIGEKTAKKLMKQFDSVEGLLANTDQLKGKQKENVINYSEQALLSKKLTTIITDVEVDMRPDDLIRHERDDVLTNELFTRLEFRGLTKRLYSKSKNTDLKTEPKDESVETIFDQFKTIEDVSVQYELVDTEKKKTALFEHLLQSQAFCFDLETTSLNRFEAVILGIAFSWEKEKAFYLPIKTPEDLIEVKKVFQHQATKVGHHLHYDLAVLLHHGIRVEGPFLDTFIIHSLLEPGQKHTMDYLAESLLGYQPIKLVDLALESATDQDGNDLFTEAAKKKAGKDLDMKSIPLEKLARYACEDADITWQLAEKLLPQITERKLDLIYKEVEAPLLPVLIKMEAEGIKVNEPALSEIGTQLGALLENLTTQIYQEAQKEFNLNSPKQLGEILFNELKLVEKPKKTKTGQFKTDEQTLSQLAPKHPIVANILSYREAAKLKSTYVDALPNHIAPHSGRIHSHFHQVLTATGRLASSDPNLQNIPIRSEAGRSIRGAFVPRGPEFTLLAADYSQIELRVMAAMAEDSNMIEAFTQNLDIHTATAATVFDVSNDEVTSKMRRTAKMVNFGIIYGISAFGLSQRLDIPRSEAAQIIETYFTKYHRIKSYMEETIEAAREHGFVETLCGRRRYLPDLQSRNKMVSNNAERAAINTPIQGTAADMIKIAMIKVDRLLEGKKSRLILQVHDELVFDLHSSEHDLIEPIKSCMSEALALPHQIPLLVETGLGKTWLEAH